MSGEAAYYRNFCMRAPRPSSVRVYAGEDTHDIRIEPDVSWARLGETIGALDPDRIELYGPDDELLRADKRKVPKSSQSVHIPSALHNDPETARLTHFADLLHRSYSHGNEVVFTRLVDIMSMQAEMYRNSLAELERLKTEYRDKLEENAELKASVAVAENEDKGDLLTSMASAFMGSAGNGAAKKGAES